MLERLIGGILAGLGLVGSIISATAEQQGSLAYGGGLAVIALAGVTLVFRSLRQDQKAMRRQLRDCEAKHELMAWRFEVVLGVLRHAGVEVPAEVWSSRRPPTDV